MALAALVMLSATPAHAQIEMTDATGGNVGIGIAPQNGTRLRVQNASASGFAPTGIEAGAGGGTTARGLYGIASGATTNIGVYGTATVATGQTAYGVYGTTDGSAGVGTTSYAGYFAGDVYVTGTVTELSDARFKVNVRDLGTLEGPEGETILDRVLALEPRAYAFTDDAAYAHLNFSEGEQYGFLAQEVDAVFPDLVREGVHPPAEAGGEPLTYEAVNYVHLVPVLVQAMQEQQAQIDALRRGSTLWMAEVGNKARSPLLATSPSSGCPSCACSPSSCAASPSYSRSQPLFRPRPSTRTSSLITVRRTHAR